MVVCTYRRPHLLEAHLPALFDQTLDPREYEIVVVDNGSGDRTPEVVTRLRRQHENLRYLLEPRVGLSRARNLGWRSARGAYVAYVDDDCIVPPQWLEIAREVVDEVAPIEFGGPIVGRVDGTKPRWWRGEYDRMHTFHYAEERGPLPPKQEIYGGNLFLLRQAIETAGGFDPMHGMSGGRQGYGEEWELHRRLCALRPEHRAWNEPRLFVHHLIRPEKLSIGWLLKERVSRCRSTHLIACGGRPVFSPWQCAVFFLGLAGRAACLVGHALLARDRKAHPYWQNELHESAEVQRVCDQLGQLLAQWVEAPRCLDRSGPAHCADCSGRPPGTPKPVVR